jgi:hypothetical protein
VNHHTDPCPNCGAEVRSATNYGTSESGSWVIAWACGARREYDGPGQLCPNRDECRDRDEATQPPEAEPVEAMTDDQLAAELEEIESLPAPLTAAQVTERELRRLEGYKGAVLADPADGKAARRLDEMRREVKQVRTTAARICKGEREEAVRIQREWVAVEKAIAERLEPVEDHLRDEAGRHDAWKAEQVRKAEAERRARIESRVRLVTQMGGTLDMAQVETATDEEWEAYSVQLQTEYAARAQAQARAHRLTEVGDECSVEEAATLTEEQYAYRLTAAQQAQREREELARIQKEQEAENARLRKAKEEAEAEAERLCKEQEAKAKAEQEAKEAEAREEKRLAEESLRRNLELAAKEKAEREEAARRPEKAQVAAWARVTLDTMPSTPAIQDAAILDRMRATVSGIRESLLDLERAMGGQP